MRTAGAALLALLGSAACVPGDSASPERQAHGRAGDGDVEQGPIEKVVTDRHEAEAREEAARRERYAEEHEQATRADQVRAMAGRPYMTGNTAVDEENAFASAWDLRLLDVLAIQLDVTGQLAAAVAEHGGTDALRAWAEEEATNAARWRLELAELRQAWYGDARAPRIEAAPGLADLGPVTQRLAARWDRGHQSEYLETPKGPTPAEEYARGIAPAVTPPDPAVAEPPFARVATDSLERLGGTVIPASVTADTFVPILRRGIAASTAGTMQASREELRALSLRIQLGEQRALARLLALTGGERG